MFMWKTVVNLLIITKKVKLVLRLLPVTRAGRTQPKFSFSVIFFIETKPLKRFFAPFLQRRKEKIITADFQLKII